MLFHSQFGLQALDTAIDRGDREYAPVALLAQQTVFGGDVTVDGQLV
jgi:hypothetical protein